MAQVDRYNVDQNSDLAAKNGTPSIYHEFLALQEITRDRRALESSRLAGFLGRFARRASQSEGSFESPAEPLEETLLPEKPSDETLIWHGIRRKIPSLSRFHSVAAEEYAEDSNLTENRRKSVFGVGAAAVQSSAEVLEAVRGRTGLYAGKAVESLGKHKKKIAIGVGVIAVFGGIALDVESIRTDLFGLATIHDAANHSHDIAKHAHQGFNAGTAPLHTQTGIEHTNQAHAVAGHANHTHTAAEHAKTAAQNQPHSQPIARKTVETEGYNFNAKPGGSITQEEINYAADHGKHLTPYKAYEIYLNLKHKLGGHLARRQYIMPDGNIGLPEGRNSLSPETVKLLKQYIG